MVQPVLLWPIGLSNRLDDAQIDELVCRHTEKRREATWMETDALRHAAGRQARCVEARERADDVVADQVHATVGRDT